MNGIRVGTGLLPAVSAWNKDFLLSVPGMQCRPALLKSIELSFSPAEDGWLDEDCQK
jgi:hypothetical protein